MVKSGDDYRNFGILILRVGIGFMFFIHGYPKLLGGTETWNQLGMAMANLGVTFFPEFWGFLAAISESLGGVLIVFGFLTRPTAAFLSFTMLVAAVFHLNKGDGLIGASHAIESCFVFVSLIFIGSGRYGFDAKMFCCKKS